MGGGACYQKGKEQGLWYEIKCLEDVIILKEKLDKDASFEKGLLKSYRQYSETDYSHRQLSPM